MSVTIMTEIDKADDLAAGLRKHLGEVKQLGISINVNAINKLEEYAKTLKQKYEEVDALHWQTTLKGHENRELLADLKLQMLAFSKAVKGRYPQMEWISYGMQDKR